LHLGFAIHLITLVTIEWVQNATQMKQYYCIPAVTWSQLCLSFVNITWATLKQNGYINILLYWKFIFNLTPWVSNVLVIFWDVRCTYMYTRVVVSGVPNSFCNRDRHGRTDEPNQRSFLARPTARTEPRSTGPSLREPPVSTRWADRRQPMNRSTDVRLYWNKLRACLFYFSQSTSMHCINSFPLTVDLQR
jgi:uncharacterized membrane protein YwzB